MKWLAWLFLLGGWCAAHAATAHLQLDVTLDPVTRNFEAVAELTSDSGWDLSLDPLFKVARVTVDGQRLKMEYSGTLPALPAEQQRNSPNPARLFASPEGSYLSAGARWYPDPGVPFTYQVRLSVPAGQKALAPGKQVRAGESGGRFITEYAFTHPAEGVWIMAGPYQVAQQSLMLDDGTPVMVRTWFHSELSAQANGYLQDSAKYIQRYSRTIGNYPFGDFSIVSSPLSHGLGMPSLTYLGRDVLRLPFIRATSLGHEVLHNWWGNGVYPEWAAGNWSEGLTTFMADYAFREEQSEPSAREMRLGWLRDLTAIAPADETSLVDFKSRQHGISSVIGYGKAAMVFLMLRDEVGQAAFERGLRLFWQRHQLRTANWSHLERAFSQASGRDLSAFFTQWTATKSSPDLVLAPIEAPGQAGSFLLLQRGAPFDLTVPLRIRSQSGEARDLKVRVRERDNVIHAAPSTAPGATEVELDPELRIWRRLDPHAVPPIFREVFISPRADLFVASDSADWKAAATGLAGRLLDAHARPVTQAALRTSPEVPALVLGHSDDIVRLIGALGIGKLPDALLQQDPSDPIDKRRLKGSAQAWTARAANGKTFAFAMAQSPEALAALQRALPHYGRQSWLVFQDGRMVEQGAWPAPAQKLILAAPGR